MDPAPDPVVDRSRRPRAIRRASRARLRSGRSASLGVLAWLATALLLSTCLALTVRLQRQAASARRAYGTTVEAWVIRRDIPAGTVLDASDVEQRPLPRLLVPERAIPAPAASPVGRTVLVPLTAGEVLLAPRLAEPDARGAAALLPSGTVGLAVPPGATGGELAPGDEVVLVLTGAAGLVDDGTDGPGATSPSPLVAGRVVGAGAATAGDRLVVAVAVRDAVRVAAAASTGEVVVGLVAPADRGRPVSGIRPPTGSKG